MTLRTRFTGQETMNRFILIATTFLAFASASTARAQDLIVIVNDAVPVTSLTVDELGRVFQKERVRWSNGLTLEPVDLTEQATTRERFSRMVYNKTTAQMKSWWQAQIFAGRAVPPVELPTEAMVVEYVRSHAGAIAYVSANTFMGEGVRRIRLAR